MPIKIQSMEVGPVQTNCYVVYNDSTKEAVLIDPGAEPKVILKYLADNKLNLKFILNTHGHPDHIGANQEIKNKYPDVPLCVHAEDSSLLTSKQALLTMLLGLKYGSPPPDRLLKEGEEIKITGLTLSVIHTPGHTPGGISLIGKEFIFTGDTLFYDSIGRSDLPGGDQETLIDSIRNKLFILDKNLTVYPGHGIKTTIGRELSENPYLIDI